MPSKDSHLATARDNELLVEQFDLGNPPARGWASTILFYAALHYVEAFFSSKSVHSPDYRTRDSHLDQYLETASIYEEYCELKNISTNARYFGRYPDPAEFSEAVLPALHNVKAEMGKHI